MKITFNIILGIYCSLAIHIIANHFLDAYLGPMFEISFRVLPSKLKLSKPLALNIKL